MAQGDYIKIVLEPNPFYWREMYFANGNGTLLNNLRVKYSFQYLIVCSLLLIFFTLLYLFDSSFIPGVLGSLIFFCLCAINFMIKFKLHYDWRKRVLEHLEGFSDVTRYELILTEESIDFATNISSKKVNWPTILTLKRTQRGVRLYTTDSYYVIPQKAMSEKDFELLCRYSQSEIERIRESPGEEEEVEDKNPWNPTR